MIGIEGQYVVSINGDEIKDGELILLAIYEIAGLGLPTFTLKFQTQDPDKVKKYTDPNHKLVVGMGKKNIDFQSNYKVFNKHVANDRGSNNYMIQLSGVIASLTYLNKQFTQSYRDKKSSDVWSTVMGRHGLNPDVEPTNDKMTWLQHYTTDRLFLREIMQFGYYADNDPLLSCIRRDLKGTYKPLSKLKKKMGTIGNTENCTLQANDFQIKNLGGVLSAVSGNTRTIPYRVWENGRFSTNEGTAAPLMTSTAGLSEDYDKKQEIAGINDNVHKKWWSAYSQQLQLLTSLSSTKLTVRLQEYSKVFPLESYEVSFQGQLGMSSTTPVNGMWLATGVTTIVQQHDFVQYVMLNRETLI